MSGKPDNLIPIGKILSPKGLRGELKIRLTSQDPSILEKLSFLYIEEADGNLSKILLERFQSQNKSIVIKIKNLNTIESVENLIGKNIFSEASNFVSEPGEKIFLSEILGFSVVNGSETVGSVKSFSSNGSQDLLVVETLLQKDVLIPLVKAFLVRIDFESKQIFMNFPPDLLDY